jgi:maleamate amidohydrolase
MSAMVEGNLYAEFCNEVAPARGELVISKQYASAFFGTSLASTLTARGVDTVVIVGCSTSGCVRATAVDSMQHGYRTIVVRECVGDRHPSPHEANLFDIDSKYGDVISKAETMAILKRLANSEWT